ncbi:hypothetical protein TNCV_259021 [Trichonephila clavipes]|uniref:Uncharacterized protein n=1 Tax=Trichonephila clavipes TaxID=2585209 RepID=A0A8X6RT93_TRICX|nr:hypothetical protein TNCV_259021 [Trichonephila clavipes]
MENHLTKLSPYGALYSLSSRLMVLDVDYEKCEPTSPKSLQEETPPPEEQLSKNLVDYLGQRIVIHRVTYDISKPLVLKQHNTFIHQTH